MFVFRWQPLNEPSEPPQELSAARSARLEIMSVCSRAAEQAEEFVHKVWEAGWRVVHHHSLPNWLRDNDFLLSGHRPPTNSFCACFKSIFKIHTETGNIWTHLLGMFMYVYILAKCLDSILYGIQQCYLYIHCLVQLAWKGCHSVENV